ncbi:MAG: ATP-binding protein [Candidatus Omnitrophica bacterium]|nr:ATP-binding protein [Candidatus Omnitrophota bacterium]
MSSTVIFYTVAALVSVVIALTLAYFAGLTGGVKPESDKTHGAGSYRPRYDGTVLEQDISDVVSEAIGSDEDARKIVKAVSGMVNEELKKNSEQQARDLGKKFEQVIEEKAQSEEKAWKKFKTVLREKKETEAVIRSIAEGLVVVNSKGNVIMMNPAAEKLLGKSIKEKSGKSIMASLKSEQLVSMIKGGAGEDDRTIEVASQSDDTKKILRASSAVIEDENGQTVGMVYALSDITKQKELDRLKASFLANISHELRTPLVAIDKAVTLIVDKTMGAVPAPQAELLTIAKRNLKRLTALINDLLDLSKLEARKLALVYKTVSPAHVVSESAENLEVWARTKSIKINKRVQDGLPDIEMDPDKITQVLTNLIGNSIKFTPQNGTITISSVLSGKKSEIVISVEDTGIGIDENDLPKLFDKFCQVGERTSNDVSGTGIGLAIAKEIVQLHGGEIWAESGKEKGARFIFTLPLKKPEGIHG